MGKSPAKKKNNNKIKVLPHTFYFGSDSKHFPQEGQREETQDLSPVQMERGGESRSVLRRFTPESLACWLGQHLCPDF